MATGKKYYWLKLQRDFFKRHDIRIIERQTNGKDYIIFYLKLLTESIDHEGRLRFSDSVPYDVEMLSVITDTNVDVCRSAVDAFLTMGLMELWDDGTLYMTKIADMIGSETDWAARKREQRGLESKKGDIVHLMSSSCPQNVPECPSELETELELEKDKKPPNPLRGGKGLNYDFIEDEEWRKLYRFWAGNKKSPYRKQAGLEAGYRKLHILSTSNLEKATQIVDQSLANNWAGIFELKVGESGEDPEVKRRRILDAI